MTIRFEKDNDKLLLVYEPEYNIEAVRKSLDEDNLNLKHTFHLGRKNEYPSTLAEESEEIFYFVVGELVDGYYRLDREVFGTEHNFYFSASIKFTQSLFVAYQRRPILPKIDNLVSSDVYISEGDDLPLGHIPFEEYLSLLRTFPTSTEITLYTEARISQAFSNYLDGLQDATTKYEQYLNRRMTPCPVKFGPTKEISLHLFQNAYEEFCDMLANVEKYREKDWQLAVCRIVRILYPKYIIAKREQCIGSDGRNKKIPDFLLVDASGFVDLLEIKKPNKQRLLTTNKYRNNYVADRDLSGAILQVEKYIYTLNHGGSAQEAVLQRDLEAELPEGMKIRITNPQGMLLMGRSNNLSPEQKLDLEIIKRQHKNLVDIMTYDDLLSRFKNILSQLEGECATD